MGKTRKQKVPYLANPAPPPRYLRNPLGRLQSCLTTTIAALDTAGLSLPRIFTPALYSVSPSVTVGPPRSAGATTDAADIAPKYSKTLSLSLSLFVNRRDSIHARADAVPPASSPPVTLRCEFPWMTSSPSSQTHLYFIFPPPHLFTAE